MISQNNSARVTAHIGGLILSTGSGESSSSSGKWGAGARKRADSPAIVALDIRQSGAVEDLDELATWSNRRDDDHEANATSWESEKNEDDIKYIFANGDGKRPPPTPKAPSMTGSSAANRKSPVWCQCGQCEDDLPPPLPLALQADSPTAIRRLRAMPRDSDWEPITRQERQRIKQSTGRGNNKFKNLSGPNITLKNLFRFGKNTGNNDSRKEQDRSVQRDMETVRKEWRRKNRLMADGEFENST